MAAITSLEHRSIAVQPGGEATCSVLLRNTGTVVDQFTIRVLGDAQAWAQVDPAAVNLLPNAESTVVVRFQPPRSPEVAAGTVPFGIRVSSREDPAGSVVEEGNLDIGAFTDVRIELIPRQARGRKQGRCDVAVDNLGNHPVDLAIDADDPERSLRFRPEHTDLTLQPGTTAFVGLSVRPERRFLRGPERTHPFQVRVAAAGVPPTTAEGAMVQEPLLPKWLPLALAGLLAALIALVVLWQTVIKQELRSSAEEAAAEQVKEVANTANKAEARAEEAAQAAGLPPKPVGGGSGDEATPSAPATPSTTPAPPGGPASPGAQAGQEPIDFRIAPEPDGVAVNQDNLPAFTPIPFSLPEDKANRTLLISDLLLQNPFGDNGFLRILREVPGPPGQPARQDVLLEVGLSNYRDLDYHFLQPWRFKPGEKVVLAINCLNPLPPADQSLPPGSPQPPAPPCKPSASFSGQLEGPPPAAPESGVPTTTTGAPPP